MAETANLLLQTISIPSRRYSGSERSFRTGAADGGMLLLNEFHPVQRKLFWSQGPHFRHHNLLVSVPNKNGARWRGRAQTPAEIDLPGK
ncbi:hypothetical protein BCL32_0127 [Rhizobium mongolense USDA 1844]|uniref:Uncharacterized protein n=1 Tax=Rhizobium mongolense USDA 1844 TaxID=1079460 RepID=A0A559TJM5_9HYPH|nr:hypothetical protein BCL32_0127 [Rhizobium mongolense USDA 1844]